MVLVVCLWCSLGSSVCMVDSGVLSLCVVLVVWVVMVRMFLLCSVCLCICCILVCCVCMVVVSWLMKKFSSVVVIMKFIVMLIMCKVNLLGFFMIGGSGMQCISSVRQVSLVSVEIVSSVGIVSVVVFSVIGISSNVMNGLVVLLVKYSSVYSMIVFMVMWLIVFYLCIGYGWVSCYEVNVVNMVWKLMIISSGNIGMFMCIYRVVISIVLFCLVIVYRCNQVSVWVSVEGVKCCGEVECWEVMVGRFVLRVGWMGLGCGVVVVFFVV